MIVGICGGTGSGKTTIARKLFENLGNERVALLEQDSYYKDLSDISFQKRQKENFDHPDSIDYDLLTKHLKKISQRASDFNARL